MGPSVPHHNIPLFKISVVGIAFACAMYFTLQMFNPHLDSEEQTPATKTAKQKQIEWMIKIFQGKNKK